VRNGNLALVPMLLGVSLGTVTDRLVAQNGLRSTRSIQLIAVKPASIEVTLDNPGPVTFYLNGGVAVGHPAPQITINWNLPPRSKAIRVCASLTGPLVASTGERASIPASRVGARIEPAGSFRMFTGSACGENSALEVSNLSVITANSNRGSRKESLLLEINEDGLNLPAGTYVGTLNIMADVVEGP
jgi:hypothetical protein